MSARIITFIIIVILLLIYILYNTQAVEVKFLFWEAQLSKALVTLGSLLVGILMGFILGRIDQFSKQRKKALQKQREQGEEEM